MDWTLLRNFCITPFALLNPIGRWPVFINDTAREYKKVQRLAALFISLTVMGLLLVLLLIGSPILQNFGVSLDSFRIAGCILFLVIGIVNGTSSTSADDIFTQNIHDNLIQAKSTYGKILIPMAMPLLVRPGVIANVILYSNESYAKIGNGLATELISRIVLVGLLAFVILDYG